MSWSNAVLVKCSRAPVVDTWPNAVLVPWSKNGQGWKKENRSNLTRSRVLAQWGVSLGKVLAERQRRQRPGARERRRAGRGVGDEGGGWVGGGGDSRQAGAGGRGRGSLRAPSPPYTRFPAPLPPRHTHASSPNGSPHGARRCGPRDPPVLGPDHHVHVRRVRRRHVRREVLRRCPVAGDPRPARDAHARPGAAGGGAREEELAGGGGGASALDEQHDAARGEGVGEAEGRLEEQALVVGEAARARGGAGKSGCGGGGPRGDTPAPRGVPPGV